jgi:hypothetical protein
MSGQPNYISWLGHGTINIMPPVTFTNVAAYGFVLNASQPAIQALANELLGPATQGEVQYIAVSAAVLVTFFDAAQCASIPEPIGFLPSRECAFWVTLLENWPGGQNPDRLVLWAPYVFIDNDVGLATGREVWGWPKALAHIAVATDEPLAPARFACKPTIIRNFGANQPAEKAELFSVEGTLPLSAIQLAEADFLALSPILFGELALLFTDGFLQDPVLPAIALKQFRDSAHPTQACFQAIVNSPCQLTSIQTGYILADTFTLSITTCASHAIITDLFGVAPTPGSTEVPIVMALILGFDMSAR